MISDEPILPWLEVVRAQVPGLELIDAHTHIGGNDPDGYACSSDELLAALERADARAVVFPMHEPGGYAAANDLVISEAAASQGRLTPFCRVDPKQEGAAEAERSLDAGAAGIKLHPRAEGFTLHHPGLEDVFALAHERERPVLVHAGRGIPALGRDALALCERYPGARLILAHAGLCDLAWIWRAAPDHPNLFFDTAWWSASDLLALFALVPPGQILFGSDAPYGTPAFAAAMGLRYALQAGLTAEQIRSVAGGQLERLLAGEEPLDVGAAPGTGSLARDPLLDRVHTFLVSALGQMFNGVEPAETLDLVRLACEVGKDAPQAPVCRSILSLLETRERYDASSDGRPSRFRPGLQFIVVAAGVSRTPDVPLPAAREVKPVPTPPGDGGRAPGSAPSPPPRRPPRASSARPRGG